MVRCSIGSCQPNVASNINIDQITTKETRPFDAAILNLKFVVNPEDLVEIIGLVRLAEPPDPTPGLTVRVGSGGSSELRPVVLLACAIRYDDACD